MSHQVEHTKMLLPVRSLGKENKFETFLVREEYPPFVGSVDPSLLKEAPYGPHVS